jgi:hypothetical protein
VPQDLEVFLTADRVGARLPAQGKKGDFELVPVAEGQKNIRIVGNLGGSDGADRAMLLFVNRSLTQDAPIFSVERWLLVPPDVVEFDREGPGQPQWKIRWKHVELERCPQAFAGYNVYRRKVGEPDSAYVKIASKVPEDFTEHTAPDAEDYVFTVKVEDLLGNESEPALIEAEDPFQGEWSGEVALVKGEFAKPIVEAFRKKQAEDEKKEQARIAKIKDDAQRHQAQQKLEKEKKEAAEFIAAMEKLLTMAEQFARLGVPVALKIERKDGQYSLGLSEVMWAKADVKDTVPMIRQGPHTLGFKDQPKELPPMFLRLYRKDEIREEEWTVKGEEEGKSYEFSFRWAFKRVTK